MTTVLFCDIDGTPLWTARAGTVALEDAARNASGAGLDCGRHVDGPCLAEVASGAPVFCLDNHHLVGGRRDAVAAARAKQETASVGAFHRIGVDRVPEGGTNEEALRAHRLDAESLATRVGAELPAGRVSLELP